MKGIPSTFNPKTTTVCKFCRGLKVSRWIPPTGKEEDDNCKGHFIWMHYDLYEGRDCAKKIRDGGWGKWSGWDV
jgi:hypothetical protein